MRKSWTDTLVQSELTQVCDDLGHFPSVSELRELGRNDLMCAITKRGGSIAWAKKMGLARLDSDSDKGWRGEIEVAGLLRRFEFSVQSGDTVKWPFDLLVNQRVRIDVKTAKYTEYDACKGWFFRIGKAPQADIIILFQQDTKDMFILPWFYCPQSNVTISRDGGKYQGYKNRFSVIESFNKSLRDIQTNFPPPEG